jgi:sigma-B regulation protein RsbU (phosphoserine phosphatase)
LPERDDVKFAALYQPARSVGGDFYDVIEMGPERFYFVIGDVSGKACPRRSSWRRHSARFGSSCIRAFHPRPR